MSQKNKDIIFWIVFTIFLLCLIYLQALTNSKVDIESPEIWCSNIYCF